MSYNPIQNIAAVAHKFLSSISPAGVPNATRPDASDLTGLAASATTDTTNASNISSGTLGASRLPNPSASTLGGVQSIVAVTSRWVRSISTSGVPALSQPDASDLTGLAASATTDTTNASNISSGTLGAARLPNPSASTLGGVQSIVAVTSNWIRSISTSGVPALSQPAFSDISGTASNAQLPTSAVTAGTYIAATITVNAQGIVTAASTGTGLGLGMSGDPCKRVIWVEPLAIGTGSANLQSLGTSLTPGSAGSIPAAAQVNSRLMWPFVTTASNGNAAGIFDPLGQTQYSFKPTTVVVITPQTITNCLIWAGGFTSNTALSTHATPGSVGGYHGASVRFLAGTDTNFQLVTFNGTTQTLVDTGIPPVVGTEFTIFVDATNSSSIKAYINGTLVATGTLTLPSANTQCFWWGASIETTTNATKELDVGKIYVETY